MAICKHKAILCCVQQKVDLQSNTVEPVGQELISVGLATAKHYMDSFIVNSYLLYILCYHPLELEHLY